MKKTLEYLDIGLVNCRQCEVELLGERTAALIDSGEVEVANGVALPPRVFMRAGGAPYCAGCSEVRGPAEARWEMENAPRTPGEAGLGRGRIIRKRLSGGFDGREDNLDRAYEGD